MVALRMQAFMGMLPARDVRLLPNEQAKQATNIYTGGGSLKPVRTPRRLTQTGQLAQLGFIQDDMLQGPEDLLNDLAPEIRRGYRIPNTPDILDLDQSIWLFFEDADTSVLRTPISNDSFERYYWCSPTEGYKFNTRQRIAANDSAYDVGVPAPQAACTVDTTGGGAGNTFTRSYVTTFVNIYGEEGQPSPPSEAVGYSDSSWDLTNIELPPTGTDYAPISKIRIYRTVTAASGATTFFFVDEIANDATTYSDLITDTIVSGQPQLQSILWAVPPDMDGITAMPNGIFVGFKGNSIYFSENFRPHAWPAEYQLTVQYPIVGLGVFGNTCVVCTQGQPAAVSGVRADAMAFLANTAIMPCLSRGSIVSTVSGVVFASETGLVLMSPGGFQELTAGVIDREEWKTRFKPEKLRATLVDGTYFAVIEGEHSSNGLGRAFMMDPTQPMNGVVEFDIVADSAVPTLDPWSGRPLTIQDRGVWELLPTDTNYTTALWRSKEFTLPAPTNLGAASISLDEGEGVFVHLRVYTDGVLRFDEDVTHTTNHIRLPSGFKSDVWQFEIETNTRVHRLDVANTFTELRSV